MGLLHRINKDKVMRKEVLKNEKKYLIYKYYLHNQYFNIKYKKFFYYRFLKIFFLKSSMSRLVNYCIKTGRAGWVLRRFKFSRITFKEFVNTASLTGVKKANW